MANLDFSQLIAEFDAEYPDTDLFVYTGPIRRPFDDQVISAFADRPLRSNLVLMLSTLGGDPDAAYRICRCLQRHYSTSPRGVSSPALAAPARNISVFVDTHCASAGTLIALGGSELIMSDYAELSPLDIQIRKPDEVGERDSGLTPTQALDILERRSKSLFKEHFNQLRLDSALGLTTKTAVEYAAEITTGLLSPIYSQLDPMRLGEVERLMGITASYGERLENDNLKSGTLAKLMAGYPSHGFVIDRKEATDLFKKVVVPKESLRKLGEWWRVVSSAQLGESAPVKYFFTQPAKDGPDDAEPQDPGDAQSEQSPPRRDREGASKPRARRKQAAGGGEGGQSGEQPSPDVG